MRRRWKIWLSVLAALLALLVVNAIVLGAETKDAETTVEGAEIVPGPHGDVQITDTGPRRGAPIVLLHCYTCSLRWWDAMLPLLERGHRVIRLDLLGHGGSEKPRQGYSMEEQAETVAAVLDRLDSPPATVVGHSLGFAVASALAQSRPDLVSRLVVIDSSSGVDNGGLGWRAQLGRAPLIGPAARRLAPDSVVEQGTDVAFAPGYDHDGFEDPDQPVEDVRSMTWTSFVDSYDAVHEYRAERSQADRIAPLGIPVLAIFGSEDQTVEDVEEAADDYRRLPDARVELIEGAGHSPNVEEPGRTAALVVTFAAEARRG